MNKPEFLLLSVLLVAVQSYAQPTFTLSGTVASGSRELVSTGDAFVLSAADSSVVKYVPVKEGIFRFEGIKKGTYLLKIACSGFFEQIRPFTLTENTHLAVALTVNPTALKEVSVTGTIKIFTNKNGNTIIDIEGSAFRNVPTPVELLSKLPAIQVAPDGESISVIGKGAPLIYIDQNRVTMNEVSSLSVTDIKTIEIINNPSVKYEAEGRVVVLITRKISKTEGTKAELSQTGVARKYYTNRLGANVSYKKKKLELQGNLQYNQIKNWEGNGYNFQIAGPQVQTSYDVISITNRTQFIAGAGAFYQINSDDYFSVSTTARLQHERFPIITESYLRQGALQTNVTTDNKNRQQRLLLNSNANFSKKFRKINAQLFLGAQLSGYGRKLNSIIYNNYNYTQASLTKKRFQQNRIHVASARADFEKTVRKGWKWETGASVSIPATKAILNEETLIPASRTGSDYRYKEKGYAAYSQLSGKWKKASVSAGLRIESTRVQGRTKDSTAVPIDKNYTNLFPKVSIDIPFDSTKSVTISYAKTIHRPDYSSISQITQYINPYFEWSGNINLQPSLTSEIAANFQYKDNSIKLSYNNVDGPLYADFQYDAQQVRLRRMDINFKKESGFTCVVNVPVKYKIWSASNSLTAGVNKVEYPSALSMKPSPYLYLYSTHQFRLPGKYALSFTGWVVTRRTEGIYERNAMYSVDTSLSKSFDKNINVTLSANNILNSIRPEERFTINDIASSGVFYDLRSFSLSFKYAFGSIPNSKYKNRDVDENASRIN